MEEKTVQTKPKFKFWENLVYACGDLGCNMSFALKGTLAVFWTQFMHIDSILYAGLLIVVQVWDAINDPLLGAFFDADKRKYRLGKFKTYILVGAIGLIVAGALCFLPFPDAPDLAKNILFLAGYILWDAFYTIANVPYGTMLSVITNEPGARASLSTWRSLGSLIANLATTVLIPILCYNDADELLGNRVFWAALIMGGIGFLCFLVVIKFTIIREDETDVTVSEEKQKFNVFKAVANFVRNPAILGVTLAVVGMFIGMYGASTAVTVMFQSYFHDVSLSGVVSAFAMIPMIAFVPFIRKLSTKFGKKEISIVGCLCSVAACLLMVVIPMPNDGTGALIYAACQFLNSLGMGVLTCVSWSLIADAIDYNEWKFGTRDEGTMYALHSFFRKLAQGVGPSLGLVVMVWLGYNEKLGAAQTATTATNIRYMVAGCYLLSAVIQLVAMLFVYNLDKKKVEQINADLTARRATAQEGKNYD